MKTWGDYYLECKDIYNKNTKIDNSNVSIYDLLIQTNPFPTDQVYFDQILSIRNKLDYLYQDKKNYLTRRISLNLHDSFHLEKELKIIIEKYLVPHLEKHTFGCYVQCSNVKIYKTKHTTEKEHSSWLWHIDNNPKEQIKVMIYLNDVDNNGPFKYLSKDNEGIKLETTKQDVTKWYPDNFIRQAAFGKFGKKWFGIEGSRIPRDIIPHFIEEHNCKEELVKGPSGTSILFDNNIIHKGTIPIEGFRYAMTLQFQPINRRLNPVFSPKNTGNGWSYNAFDKNPESPIIKKTT
tara:strand:- start:4671 stop:5546 length:876 start_codon:yes stop_codon:yes gene_type:complete